MVASRGDREHRLAGVVIALVVPVASTTAETAATIAPVAHAAVAAAPTTPVRPDYRSLPPTRVADTRPGQVTIDGQAQGAGKLLPARCCRSPSPAGPARRCPVLQD